MYQGIPTVYILITFSRKHIPVCLYFDIMHQVVQTAVYPRNIPSASTFEQYVCSLGVDPDTHVVVYDNTGQGGFFTAGRAWWLFKVVNTDIIKNAHCTIVLRSCFLNHVLLWN